jgi:hypothetical protein
MVCDLFFKEIGSRGSHKIPKSGPVLFACAPHANQASAWRLHSFSSSPLLLGAESRFGGPCGQSSAADWCEWQFLDPVVVLRAATGRSDIGYLAAAKSMRRKFIGMWF